MNDKKNMKWTDEMDDCLVDALFEQKLKGQKIGGSFTKTAYTAVVMTVSVKFAMSCDPEHVKNRVKTLKKYLATVKDLLQKKSGFGFNYSTRMIEAEEDVWANYLKGKPNASHLRYTPLPNFEKLAEIFGKDRATGSREVGPKQRRVQWEANDNNPLGDDDEFDLQDDTNNEVSSSSKVAPNSSTSKPSQEPKKNRATCFCYRNRSQPNDLSMLKMVQKHIQPYKRHYHAKLK